jgi:hypothetical protein
MFVSNNATSQTQNPNSPTTAFLLQIGLLLLLLLPLPGINVAAHSGPNRTINAISGQHAPL